MSIDEMEKYRDKDRQEEAGTCIMGEMRKDREGAVPNDVDGLIDHYRHEVRKGQEAYDQLLKELNMLRGTKQIVERLSGENQKMKKRAQAAQGELDRIKKDNNDLFNRVADALAINEDHQKLNGKLQERLTELEEDNKKLNTHLHGRIYGDGKSGM